MTVLSRTVLFALLVAAAFVLAAPSKRLTNSDRIARGLPLAAPKRLYDPTRTHQFKARASVDPDTPINAFIRVDPVDNGGGGIPGRRDLGDMEKRGPEYSYLWDASGYYAPTAYTPDTWTFYGRDALKNDAAVYTVRNDEPVKKMKKRYIAEGWWGASQWYQEKDVNEADGGIIGFELFSTASTSTGYNDVSYRQTNIFVRPAIDAKVEIQWYNENNLPVSPKFYYAAIGQDSKRIYAAFKPSDIDESVTDADEVTLTWVLPINLNEP